MLTMKQAYFTVKEGALAGRHHILHSQFGIPTPHPKLDPSQTMPQT